MKAVIYARYSSDGQREAARAKQELSTIIIAVTTPHARNPTIKRQQRRKILNSPSYN